MLGDMDQKQKLNMDHKHNVKKSNSFTQSCKQHCGNSKSRRCHKFREHHRNALEISVSTMCIPDNIWHTLLIQSELAASQTCRDLSARCVGAGWARPGNRLVIWSEPALRQWCKIAVAQRGGPSAAQPWTSTKGRSHRSSSWWATYLDWLRQ